MTSTEATIAIEVARIIPCVFERDLDLFSFAPNETSVAPKR